MLSTGFFVVHDASRSGQDEIAELTGWQQVSGVCLEVLHFDVKTGADHTALVQTAGEVHNNLAGSMIVDDFELANVTMLDHNIEEFHDHLRRGPDQNLALASLLGVVDRFQGISQDVHTHHFDGFEWLGVPERDKTGKIARNDVDR